MASQYGGGPDVILETVSLYQVIRLVQRINDRQIFDYKMAASIATYPNLDKKDKKQFMDNLDRMSSKNKSGTNKLDKTGFEALKFMMSQNPRIVVK